MTELMLWVFGLFIVASLNIGFLLGASWASRDQDGSQ